MYSGSTTSENFSVGIMFFVLLHICLISTKVVVRTKISCYNTTIKTNRRTMKNYEVPVICTDGFTHKKYATTWQLQTLNYQTKTIWKKHSHTQRQFSNRCEKVYRNCHRNEVACSFGKTLMTGKWGCEI